MLWRFCVPWPTRSKKLPDPGNNGLDDPRVGGLRGAAAALSNGQPTARQIKAAVEKMIGKKSVGSRAAAQRFHSDEGVPGISFAVRAEDHKRWASGIWAVRGFHFGDAGAGGTRAA